MRKALILAIVVVTMMAPTAAWAGPPEVVFDGPDSFSDLVPAGAICDFAVHIEETVNVRVTHFFDKNGDFRRETVHITGRTNWTTDSGAVVEHWAWNGTFDPEELTFTQAGNVWNGHAKGQGIVINDSGLIVIDVTTEEAIVIRGPHQAWEGDFGDFCAALSP